MSVTLIYLQRVPSKLPQHAKYHSWGANINDLSLHMGSAEIDLYADDTTLISAAHCANVDNLQSSLTTAISIPRGQPTGDSQ